ncbi:MFS transporter [Vibrio spartinae]|uniref:Bacillibactin exporter n=1 Tax=Vibrio spartinae TaxID=1918945 RepID=A0A1N6M6S4_9VIBR|nr:MFS transporter [Vibrio spartinae]QMV13889.1 Bacillibactin exporter [Vibrio spartinae]SIO95152.1 Bacillibactin exporter [Vibrio spartinae]
MRKLKLTILSLSLVTVMSGAAVAPALGEIAQYFHNTDTLLIQLVITLPALFIILTSLLFSLIANKFSSKTIAVTGLLLYIIGGNAAGLANTIYEVLAFRAVLGIGVGLIMPLSTGLIAFYFDKKEQSKLMGYSSAMNNLGGIIATVLSGYLVALNWRYSFFIYLVGIVVLILVIIFLPKTEIRKSSTTIDIDEIKKISPYVICMFITMIIFYTVPSNFAIVMSNEQLVPTSFIGLLMAVQTIVSFVVGMTLSILLKRFHRYSKFLGSGVLTIGLYCLSMTSNILLVISGLAAIGIGLGIMVPILNSQISLHVKKENMTSAMAIMSAMLYLGQFLSPIITDDLQSIFNLNGMQVPFYIAMIMALVLTISLIKIPFSIALENNK